MMELPYGVTSIIQYQINIGHNYIGKSYFNETHHFDIVSIMATL